MEQAAILYGDYDGKGNSLVIRTNELNNLLYTVDGYLIGFTINGVDYFHFEKNDFKSEEVDIDAGYFSMIDWLNYWAKNKELADINKFDNANFNKVQEGDLVIVKKQKISPNTAKYNLNEIYKYDWNFKDKYLISFIRNKIFIPSNINATIEDYTPETTATTFFNTNKGLINQITNSQNKEYLAQNLIYSSYCIHHICNSIFTLFTDSSHQNLINEQKTYWSNPFSNTSGLSELELLNLTKDFYTEVLNFYVTGFRNKVKIQEAIGDKKFYNLTLFMSVKSLTTLTSSIKLKVLKSAADEMSRFFERESVENLIVRLASSFDNDTVNRIDEFLEGLIDPKNYILIGNANEDKVTLYQYLYDRMSTSWNITKGLIQLSNWVGNTKFKATDTKGAFVQTIYLLWQFSKYNPYDNNGNIKTNILGFKKLDNNNNPKISYNIKGNNDNKLFYYSHESASEQVSYTENDIDYFYYDVIYANAAPLLIPYNVEKSVGLYLNKMDFTFTKNKISVSEIYDAIYETDDGPMRDIRDALYGTYDIFQPVSLLNTNIESSVPILTTTGNTSEINGLTINSFIPIFVLKYYDDSNDRSNTETMIGYTIDGVLTFSGIGNLTKLRHLRWAALGAEEVGLFTKQGLRVALGGLEFSSGVVGYLANFIECNANDEFCKNFKNFVMGFQIATLSLTAADGIATLAMRQSAKGVVKATGKTNEAEIIAEIKARLKAMDGNNSSPETIDRLSNHIYLFSGVPLSLPLIRAIRDKILKAFKGKTWDIHPSYTDAFLEDYIKLCKSELNLDDKTIIDLVVYGNKPGHKNIKFIEPKELEKQTLFYVKEISVRGFGGGFNNLVQYKQYCNAIKNGFKQNLLSFPANDLSDHITSLEFVMKGSSARTLKLGDPKISHSGAIIPLKNAGDLDMGFRLNALDYDNFLEELKKVARDVFDSETDYTNFIRQIDKTDGKLQYDEIFKLLPIGNSNFAKKIQEIGKPFTNFKSENIGFAIIKKGGKYDTQPEITFKY